MKYPKNYRLILSLIFALLVSFTLNGFSQNLPDKPENPGFLKLEYSFISGQKVKYKTVSKIIQKLDINGETMQVDVESTLGCTVNKLDKQSENLKLEILIDTLAQTISMPQGSSGGVITGALGKSFNMLLTSKGKEADLSEAEKIVFNIEGSGEENAKMFFLDFFPDLPAETIKQGDTWISNDTVDYKSTGMSVLMIVHSNNKFEGVEYINGIECAKIFSTITGTSDTKNQSQNGEIHTTGPITGTVILFFAIKEGYIMRQNVTTKLTGNLEISDQGMTIPLVMDSTSTREVVK